MPILVERHPISIFSSSIPSPCVGIRTCSDYSPFGVELDGRTVSGGYRFGYQGSEKDNEFKADGNSYTTEFRQLDPRLGRWLSVDPVIQPWQSSYCAMDCNPICLIDNSGTSTDDPIGPGYYQANVSTRMIAFGSRHFNEAMAIGMPERGSTNISTNAVRFSTRINLNENYSKEGSQVNAFRHVLWQAEITKEFGSGIAKEVGNLHEENAFAANGSNLKYTFKNLSEADETIDLLNNVIGRNIGASNPNANMKDLALKTLDYYKQYGLWEATAIYNSKGVRTGYTINQKKINDQEYKEAKEIIQKLNSDGFTKTEQQNRKLKYEAEKMSLQNNFRIYP